MTVSDFNGDRIPDLAVANSESADLSVLLGNGDGTFQAPLHFGDTTPQSIVAADLNRDGRQDLALANFGSDNISVLIKEHAQVAGSPPRSVWTGSARLRSANGNPVFRIGQRVLVPRTNDSDRVLRSD